MRILFAIQGTGNGHISRAREIVPLLQEHGQVDLLISGTQADVALDQPLAYRFHGFSFVFGKRGSVDYCGIQIQWPFVDPPGPPIGAESSDRLAEGVADLGIGEVQAPVAPTWPLFREIIIKSNKLTTPSEFKSALALQFLEVEVEFSAALAME